MNYRNTGFKVVSAAAVFVGILTTASQSALASTFNTLSHHAFNSVLEPGAMIVLGSSLMGLRVFLSARAKRTQPLSVKAS